jgi:hypothetical protein
MRELQEESLKILANKKLAKKDNTEDKTERKQLSLSNFNQTNQKEREQNVNG